MKEIVIFPNINQIIEFRELQKHLCSIPSLPLCIKSPALSGMDIRIEAVNFTEITIKESGEAKIFVLGAKIRIGGADFEAEMELGKAKKETILPQNAGYPKKLKSYRLAEMECKKEKNGFTWEVFREKWIKSHNQKHPG